jgi:exodeoxyribonuclease-5
MHTALEQMFKHIPNSHSLRSLKSNDLSQIIDDAVETSLQQHAKTRLDIFTPSFQSLESQRLKRILREWLSLEASRPSEWEIAALEQPSQVTLGELTLKIKLDRVDKFSDNTNAVIDYKTGRTHRTNEWTDDRPSECQIPLYAMATQKPSVGAIAQVHAKESKFIGMADNNQRLKGVTAIADNKQVETWDELLAHWETTLNQLAQELVDGRIDVEPKKYACDYCELDSLCRISQAQLTEEVDDADS